VALSGSKMFSVVVSGRLKAFIGFNAMNIIIIESETIQGLNFKTRLTAVQVQTLNRC